MTEKKRNKRGPKPSIVVTEEFLDKVEELSRKQFTQEQIRAYYGAKKSVWYKTSKDNPEIKIRIRRGKCKQLEYGVNKLMQKIEEGDVKCLLFYLERKGGWTAENSIKLDAKLKSDKKSPLELKITTLDPIEAGRIYEQLMTTTGS